MVTRSAMYCCIVNGQGLPQIEQPGGGCYLEHFDFAPQLSMNIFQWLRHIPPAAQFT